MSTREEDSAGMQEDSVAEAIGVSPETLNIPSQVRRGVLLFELENGKFGFRATNEITTMMDVFTLAVRVQAHLQADMIASRVMEKEQQVLATMKKAQQHQNLIVPRPGIKKP